MKAEQDCERERTVSWSVKAAIAVFIFLLNAFFIYFTILRGYDKGLAWQVDYCKAWIVQLLLDVFVFETVQCAWIHVLIPSLVSTEVRRVSHLLQQTVQSIFDGSYEQQDNSNAAVLNAPEHLFVSYRLADAYPELLESKVVKAYASHLPGATSRIWLDLLKHDSTRPSSSVVLLSKTFLLAWLVQMAAYAPLHAQSLLLRVLEPMLLAALTFAFLLFLHEPEYLSILGVAVLILGALLLRDYYRARVADDDALLPSARIGIMPAVAAVSTVLSQIAGTEDAMENDPAVHEDLLFHRLFEDADEKSDEDEEDASSVLLSSDSDGTLPDCLKDASDESSIADSVVDRLFGGSEDGDEALL